MSIKPVLFNTEMVRAILNGRKTCTRRLIKDADKILNSPFKQSRPDIIDEHIISKLGRRPYCKGDILYVREAFAWQPCWDCGMDGEQEGCEHEAERRLHDEKKEHGCYMYRAACEDNEYPSADTWHPSIHMPKEAARIWLKVTNVRVERLQEISAESALAEGADKYIHTNGGLDENMTITSFIGIWNSTIKKSDLDSYGWDASPWVWVIEFERCEKPKGV